MSGCIIYIYIFYYILAYIQHKGDVSLEKQKAVSKYILATVRSEFYYTFACPITGPR